MRGVATAIARAEVATLRDDLTARVVRIEARLAALEQKPVAAPALVPIPPAPITAAADHPPPLAVTAPPLPITPPPLPLAPVPIAPVALPPPPIASTPVIVDLSRISDAGDFDHPFANAARRRRRMAVLFVCLLVAAVGSIVVTAIVSQALNDHSSRR